MKLFLADIYYTERWYESNEEKKHHAIHLVKAENEDQAKEKAERFIEAKTSAYSVYYDVVSCVVTETIE
jgi:hypothetical protein